MGVSLIYVYIVRKNQLIRLANYIFCNLRCKIANILLEFEFLDYIPDFKETLKLNINKIKEINRDEKRENAYYI